MNPILFSIGGLVFAIGIFKRELLVQKGSFMIILGISAALFAVALLLYFTAPHRYRGSGALFCPLLSLGVFRFYRKVFLVIFKREPKDTWLDWQSGMGFDRVFNILCFSSIGLLWAVVSTVM